MQAVLDGLGEGGTLNGWVRLRLIRCLRNVEELGIALPQKVVRTIDQINIDPQTSDP